MLAESLLDDPGGAFHELLGADGRRAVTPGLSDRRDADVHGVGARIGRDLGVVPPQQRFAEDVGDLRLADAHEAVRADGDVGAEPARPEPWQGLVMPHRPHLARGTGQGHDDPAVRPRHEPAGRGAVRVGQGARRGDQPGLFEVELGEGHVATRPELAQPRLEGAVDDRGLADDGGDRFTGEVVGRGTQAAGRDDEVRAAQGVGEGRGDDLETIWQGRDPRDGHAGLGERPGELARVGVPGFPDRQLRADAQELPGTEATLR